MRILARVVLAGWICASPCRADGAESSSSKPIAVVVTESGKFGVVYHRTNPPGVGGVVAGLVGAAIQVGMQSSDDDAMAKQVMPLLSDPSCGSPVAAAMIAELRANGGYAPMDVADNKGAVAAVEVKDCGLRLVDTSGKQVASYVNLRLKLTPAGGKAWVEDIQVTGRERHPFDDFAKQAGLAQRELGDVLNRAGKRAADKIIYQKL